jgi:hypothetical protein
VFGDFFHLSRCVIVFTGKSLAVVMPGMIFTPFWFLTNIGRSCGLIKGGYTLVTLPRTVTPYRDSVDETRDHVTYQTLVTR